MEIINDNPKKNFKLYKKIFLSKNNNMKKYRKRKKRMQKLKKISVYVFGLIVVSVFIINIQLALTLYNNKQKIETTTDEQERTTRLISQLIDDSKEIRETLELPALIYEQDFQSDIAQRGGEGNDTLTLDEQTFRDTDNANKNRNEPDGLAKQMKLIYDTFYLEQVSQSLSTIIETYTLYPYANTLGLDLQQKNNTIIIRYKTYIIATIEALYDEDFAIQRLQYKSSLIGKNQMFDIILIREYIDKMAVELQKNIGRSLALETRIKKLFASNEIRTLLKNNRGSMAFNQSDRAYSWRFYNILKQEIFFLELSKFDYTIKTSKTSIDTGKLTKRIVADIKDTLYAINFKTKKEQIAFTNMERVKKYISDTTFQTQLKALGLTISSSVRQDNDYYYLDITSRNTPVEISSKIGAFAILKSTGTFWTIDKDDVPIAQTSMFDIAPQQAYTQYTNQNILLVGSHNGLADTIMLVHIDEHDVIKIMSIPRDIYYQGRKINWYFKRFSPNNFNKVIANITGVPITKYIYVDMYSFISIIDILGGIDVVLTQDLTDTAYTIKDNGVLSYLHYEAGEHHVSGIEALRIARSRYSTNDFNRSSRQQAIITGITKKLKSVDNLSAFLSIIKAIDTIDPLTNISTIEMATMVNKYKHANISERMVLSTKNILYSTYSNIYEHKIPEKGLDSDDVDKGQWILLPKNNDWDLLQNFIERFILE